MAGRPYTARFFAGAVALPRNLVTVPAGHRWVIRQIDGHHSAQAWVFTSVAGVGLGPTFRLEGADTDWGGSWSGRQVLYQGEQLQAWSVPEGAWMMISGYDFLDG